MTIRITEEFSQGLSLITKGHHVLITGKAGTGKSTLLRTFLEKDSEKNILVTAPTGVAALNIDGFTIHRIFGFRPGMWPDDVKPGGDWTLRTGIRSVLQAVDILVIDEISMVRADLFDMMNIALQRARNNQKPFGGVQLILVGDLLQLPPVVEDSEREIFSTHWKSPFFFSAHCYESLRLQNINLTHVWRQSDSEFIEILNQVREGSVGQAALDILNERVEPQFQAPDDWVTLASRKRTVAKINGEHLTALPSEKFLAVAQHSGTTDGVSFSGDDELHYAVGARIMTVTNDPAGRFVNGSFGIITDASADKITVRLDHSGESVIIERYTWELKKPSVSNGRIQSDAAGTIKQFPIILAWAITIHKSQGKTIPKCFINLSGGTTTDGQFYVALSRAVDLDNLRFSAPVEPRHIRANNTLVRMIRREVSPKVETDRVVFLSFDGVNFGISDHIARAHAIIVEGSQIVADFGTWINPMADLGEFGRVNSIPAGGLALAPTLGDFWPLLRRQAAGGIVIGDRLPMLERAVRHQEKGLELNLGVGYNFEEFDLELKSTSVEDRCLEMVASYQVGKFTVTQGVPAPDANLNEEGSVYIPAWAPPSNMVLDQTQATESDRAWAAFSGGETTQLEPSELVETAELLSAWAVSRSYWNETTLEEVKERAHRAGLTELDLPPTENKVLNLDDLFTPRTRVAFTGRDNLLGGPADDARLTEICSARELVYKTGVSRSRCDVLVALDPASMSRKAQNAREYGKPIVSQADFEDWYENAAPAGQRVAQLSVEPTESVEATTPTPQTVASQPETTPVESPEDMSSRVSTPSELFTHGTRVAFRGTTMVDGNRYAHGEQLQSLCASLGLEYKQAVTKTRCDVLVTDDLTSSDGKTMLAKRYDKPLVTQESFDRWATKELADLEDLDNGREELKEPTPWENTNWNESPADTKINGDASHWQEMATNEVASPTVSENKTSDSETFTVGTPPLPTQVKAGTATNEPRKDPAFEKPRSNDEAIEPTYVNPLSAFETAPPTQRPNTVQGDYFESKMYEAPAAFPESPDAYPQPQYYAPFASGLPDPLMSKEPEPKPNKPAQWFKKSLALTAILFILTIVAAGIDVTTGIDLFALGAFLILGSILSAGASTVLGLALLLQKLKDR